MKNIVFVFGLAIPLLLAGQRRASGVVSPELLPDNSVIFRLKVSDAHSVEISGTWATGKITPMEKRDSVYEIKLGPLASDMYEYDMILDGVPILDPNNNMVTRDGAWIQNRLFVPGAQADLYDVKDIPHGSLNTIWYDSPTIGMERRMLIYTPPAYTESDREYPVLYLLHGGGGDEEGWVSRGRVNYILDNLIVAGKAVPMIVVMANGNPNTPAAPSSRPAEMQNKLPSGIGSMASGKFEESLIQDIIPYVEKNYRVRKDARQRAITGFSMGGFQTQNITNANPAMFKYIGVMSMGLFSSMNGTLAYDRDKHIRQLKALQENAPKVYWIGIARQDFLYDSVTKLKSLYDEIGFKYTYRENEGNHDWNSWRLYLSEFVPLLFK